MKTIVLLLGLMTSSFMNFAQQTPIKLNDSAMAFYKQNPKRAITVLEEALRISEANKNPIEIARTQNNLGIVFRDLGNFEKAKQLSTQALTVSDSMILASAYNNIGVVNRSLGLYDEALVNYLKSLDIYQAKSLEREIATTLNSIGLVYSYNGMNEKAIEYHQKAKVIFETIDNKKGISEVLNNLAIIYANDGHLDEALNYFKKSLAIEETLGDKKGMAESVNNVGAVYYYKNEMDSALVYFNQSVTIEKSIGNQAGVAASYNNIADALLETNRVEASKKYIDSALFFAQNSKVAVDIEAALHNYSKYYEFRNEKGKALDYYKRYTIHRDSTLNINTNAKIAELEIGYQTEKHEKEILSQRAHLAEKELALNKKNAQLIGMIVFAIVLVIFGYLIYNQQKLKNRQLQKENELKDALIKIETQNRLQEQRLRISRDLHDNIGAQLTFIISSLDNLKYGFQLPERLNSKLTHISAFATTTIYELRDTIWAMNKNEISFEDLHTRISNFIEKADLSAAHIHFDFSYEASEKTALKFTSVEGMNIFRIIQESINNAIKYAEASHIKVECFYTEGVFKIKIKDDGKGFDFETAQMGNGIANMKKRANEIDAQIKIQSQVGQGTEVSLKKRPLLMDATNDG